MFDSFLWLTSSTVYLGGLLFTLLAFYSAVRGISSSKPVYLWAVFAFLLSAWAGMFTEPMAICSGVLAAALAVLGIVRKNKRGILIWAATWAGFIAGFAVVYFSPGTVARRKIYGTDFSITQIMGLLPKQCWNLATGIFPWMSLLVFVAGVVAFVCANSEWKAQLNLGKLFTCTVIGYLIFVVFRLMVAQMGNPEVALRTYTNPAVFSIFVTFALGLCIGKLVSSWAGQQSLIAVAVYAIAALVFFVPLVGYFNTIHTGLALRSHYLDLRAESVKEQIAASPKATINFVPLPVPFVSEAVDFNAAPGAVQIPWVLEEIPAWYGMEKSQKAHIGQLPKNYCILQNDELIKRSLTCN